MTTPVVPEEGLARGNAMCPMELVNSAGHRQRVGGVPLDLVAVERALVEPRMRHGHGSAMRQHVAQMGQLLGDGADQADGHPRLLQGRAGPLLRSLPPWGQSRHSARLPAREDTPLDRQLAGIDHLIIGVRDLEAARQRFARLGFNSTPRGRHVGWGTANYCIMFERDYLELLGIVDASQFTNRLDRFLAEREGLLGIVVASRDADGTRASWIEAGAQPEEVRALGRLLEGEDGPVELRFNPFWAVSSSIG